MVEGMPIQVVDNNGLVYNFIIEIEDEGDSASYSSKFERAEEEIITTEQEF